MILTSNNCYRHGLTLIEVVAGLALMGTLLATMLTAKGRFTQQRHYAQRVLAAVDAADTMLAARWDKAGAAGGTDGWASTDGVVANNDRLTWRTVEITDDQATAMRSRVIRLEVFDEQSNPEDPPLVSIDLLVPLYSETSEGSEGPGELEEPMEPQEPGAPEQPKRTPDTDEFLGTEESAPQTEITT